ncbi:MAG: serine protease [Phycisphaerales bacterium]|nr:serine protease [Phycisphaerales bacterium]
MRICFVAAVQAALLASTSFLHAAAPATQPAPPAWMAKPTTAWPQILLTNKQTDNSNHFGFSGSSGLARLPNGVVVLLTAGHLLNGVAPTDFAKGFKSWVAVPSLTAVSGVRMKSIAMDTAKPIDLDAIALLPNSQTPPWPGIVCTIRETPLEVGETVYLIAIPADKVEHQHVRKAEVVRVNDNHTVEYNVEGKFITTGNSGAPVIDTLGRYCGVNTAHLDNQDDPAKMKLVLADASALLREVVLPAGMKPLVLAPATTAPAGTRAAGPQGAAKAEQYVAAAEQLAQNGQTDMARVILQSVVNDYPGSPSAKKAKALLATLGK